MVSNQVMCTQVSCERLLNELEGKSGSSKAKIASVLPSTGCRNVTVVIGESVTTREPIFVWARIDYLSRKPIGARLKMFSKWITAGGVHRIHVRFCLKAEKEGYLC